MYKKKDSNYAQIRKRLNLRHPFRNEIIKHPQQGFLKKRVNDDDYWENVFPTQNYANYHKNDVQMSSSTPVLPPLNTSRTLQERSMPMEPQRSHYYRPFCDSDEDINSSESEEIIVIAEKDKETSKALRKRRNKQLKKKYDDKLKELVAVPAPEDNLRYSSTQNYRDPSSNPFYWRPNSLSPMSFNQSLMPRIRATDDTAKLYKNSPCFSYADYQDFLAHMSNFERKDRNRH
ncbi:unnamed protein product [Moneuplotes crassus]|uniref:Uncharacterized protein n=1 Tax=Euplotes crassus TaxID=5936 RepID=A0AAD1XTU5_EUPCR|nr:unnamed protein product [Moneuplotes crassus]